MFGFNTGAWKPRGTGFRFLHDEISGGVFGYSHLKVKSAYTGPAVQVNSVDYNFASNITPLAIIQAAEPSDQFIVYYEQVNGYHANLNPDGIGCWDGIDYTALRATSASSGISINFSDPKTYIVIYDASNINGNGIATIAQSASIYQSVFFAGTNGIWLRKRNGSPSATQQHNFATASDRNGLHLLIWNDGGSLNASDWDFYFDDVITPLSPSATSGAISDATLTNSIGIKDWAANATSFVGCVHEFHCFNGILDLSQRQTVKDVLSQYYTFT